MEEENILLTLLTPQSVPLGNQVQNIAHIGSEIDDENKLNNLDTLLAEVIGSFDPNDKQAVKDFYTVDEIADGVSQIYTIRFQNTGTYPASFVRIVDTLSNYLNPATFELLAFSHPVSWSMEGAGIVEFYFEDINLPDSTSNELESHGFVKFSIKPNDGVALGTEINNTAYIYFDYNEPVVTNTVITPVEFIDLVQEYVADKPLLISPNPSFDHAFISLPEMIGDEGTISIFSVKGERLEVIQNFKGQHIKINISDYANGLYFITWKIGEKFYLGKINKRKLTLFQYL